MNQRPITTLLFLLSSMMGAQSIAAYPPPPIPYPAPYPDGKFSGRRLDCRFDANQECNRTCNSSATYLVNDLTKKIKRVHFGVECDRQTLFDGKGTIEPQETVADHIRPATAATPLVELSEQNDLRNPGSYTAKLEVEFGKIVHGHCYVTNTDDDDNYMQ